MEDFMSIKVALDAGHGGMDSGSIFGSRNEKDDNLRLTVAVGKKLEDAGVDVYYTRTEDVYDSPIERARMANDTAGDLLVSIHRNDATTPNTYTGAEAFIHSAGGIKARVAERILDNLSEVGYLNLGVNTMANDAMLKRTQMPAILLEIGFINTDSDNELFDTRLDEIAEAISAAIGTELRLLSNEYPYTYRVQVGGLGNESLAQRIAYQLFLDGYEPVILPSKENLFVVHVGEIYTLDQAVMLEQFLKLLGYNTFVITEENKE